MVRDLYTTGRASDRWADDRVTWLLSWPVDSASFRGHVDDVMCDARESIRPVNPKIRASKDNNHQTALDFKEGGQCSTAGGQPRGSATPLVHSVCCRHLRDLKDRGRPGSSSDQWFAQSRIDPKLPRVHDTRLKYRAIVSVDGMILCPSKMS